MNKIYQGSTKDIIEHKGVYTFQFKDDYSVFDWGKMPDTLDNKGFYLCQIGGALFEFLSEKNIKHHMHSYFNQTMKIEHFKKEQFIDLEVIFRFGVPSGSSLLKRGYKENEKFATPLIEFTTKREAIDRSLSHKEAQEISQLDERDFQRLINKTQEIATLLQIKFAQYDITLWDGKFEFAFDGEEFILTDSIGLDELRLSYKGIYFSKELLRQYYKNSAFYTEINEHKEKYQMIKHSEIKNPPQELRPNVKKHMQQMYEAFYRLLNQDNRELLERWIKNTKHFSFDQKVIVIGDGGREHTIAKTMADSPFVSSVYVHTKRKNVFNQNEGIRDIYFEQTDDLIQFCKNEKIDLVIIGPEAPLCAGLASELRNADIATLGPDKACSQLESSKIFTKNFLKEAQIPSAQSVSFPNYKETRSFLKQSLWDSFVIKVDGLAAGKGVAVCDSQEQALKELENFHQAFPHTSYLIEEKLQGRELSLFYLIDQNEIKFLGDACDHKALLDGNLGPNTGGMGTYSPCDWIEPQRLDQIKTDLSIKIHQTLKAQKLDYNGILFVGLMLDKLDYHVLEFNIRLGDPETQVLLPRIKDDLYVLFKQAAHNELDQTQVSFKSESFVHIVCSSKNYPYGPSQKEPIYCQPFDAGAQLILAGVEKEGDYLMASGGRVCGITAMGEDKKQARKLAYENIKHINFSGKYYRNDIAN